MIQHQYPKNGCRQGYNNFRDFTSLQFKLKDNVITNKTWNSYRVVQGITNCIENKLNKL